MTVQVGMTVRVGLAVCWKSIVALVPREKISDPQNLIKTKRNIRNQTGQNETYNT